MDILINNASINVLSPFCLTKWDEWWRLFDVNAKGVRILPLYFYTYSNCAAIIHHQLITSQNARAEQWCRTPNCFKGSRNQWCIWISLWVGYVRQLAELLINTVLPKLQLSGLRLRSRLNLIWKGRLEFRCLVSIQVV